MVRKQGCGAQAMCQACVRSRAQPSATPGAVACQAPLSMGFPRQEYWRGSHFLLQRFFPAQGSNLCLLYLLHSRQILCPLGHEGSSASQKCFRITRGACYSTDLGTPPPPPHLRHTHTHIHRDSDLVGLGWA